MKAFLHKVMIVGEHVREAFPAHHVHSNAIRETVFLVGTRLVERQRFKKGSTGLWNHRPLTIL